MSAKDILSDQVIIKKGRFNTFGFEPCSNSFFDFYVSPKYIDPPLLKLEDISFHLFLRKNINDRNPAWKMPSINQMMRRLDISYSRLSAMMKRLEQAHLLTKESGLRKGTDGRNLKNEYILSDPIQTLEEFLEVASAGLFPNPLKPEYAIDFQSTPEEVATATISESTDPYRGNRDTPTSEIASDPTAEIAEHKQTLNTKQTYEKACIDPAFEELRISLDTRTFERFLNGAKLISIEEGIAVIGTLYSYAKDFIENRLANKLKYALKVDAIKCVVLTE